MDLGDWAMEAIIWWVSYEFTKFQAEDVHLGHDALYLQVVILHMRHSVDKLIEQPCIGKITHYQHCFPHIVKPNQINHYVKDEQITTTKDGVKSFDNVIYDYYPCSIGTLY
jgi:hypothetical protein